jgi:hypothetical protein
MKIEFTGAVNPSRLRGRWRLLLPILGSLMASRSACAIVGSSYYELDGPYHHGTGAACVGGVDVATGSIEVQGQM